MKAFLIAMVALVVITIGANLILTQANFSSEAASASSGNVRIED
ncbi:hypothetical protein ACEWPL_008345 [Roseovarius sp. S1116L3]